MNRALLYLWFVLLKRRGLHGIRGLRRPTSLIGFAAWVFFLCVLFHYRDEAVFAQLVRRESLIGGAMIMLGGSLFMGFLQRGLVFEPPDVEFLFTSPFTQRQIVVYRLLPNYLYALVQGLVFLALFASHLKHPLLTAVCMMLFQVACFHLATGAAIFGGTISEQAHVRVRWMMLGVYFVMAALYLRVAWDLKVVPSFMSSPLTQLFFYPAATLSDIGTEPVLREWMLRRTNTGAFPARALWESASYLGVFAGSAVASFWLLLKLRANIFETSLATTTRKAERRVRLQQGRSLAVANESRFRSARLPKGSLFHGVGAIVWKHLIVASRSKRELVLAGAFTLIYTGFLAALRGLLHHLMSAGGELPAPQVADFDRGLLAMLCFLAFFMQRTFPFDFRRDGHHLVGFRTLPISPFALALAEITVPTA